MPRPRLYAVNVVHEVFRGPTRYTAIDKRPVTGPVAVDELGLAGDKQCDSRPAHGVTVADTFDPKPDAMRRLSGSGIDLAEPILKIARRALV
jgi:hypothetical protein